MIERNIYCKEKHLKGVLDVLDIYIPNNYDVDLEDYRIHRNNYDDMIDIQLFLDSPKDWVTLKKNYFEGMYYKRSLPGCIRLK